MRFIDWFWSVPILLLSLAACTPSPEPDDSLAALPRWSSSAEPTAVLADDGTPARQFTRVAVAPLASGDLLAAGHEGAVWVRRFELTPGPTRMFVIIGPTGGAIARITIPAELTIHQVGPDFLLGVRHGIDGVESVVEFRLLTG